MHVSLIKTSPAPRWYEAPGHKPPVWDTGSAPARIISMATPLRLCEALRFSLQVAVWRRVLAPRSFFCLSLSVALFHHISSLNFSSSLLLTPPFKYQLDVVKA